MIPKTRLDEMVAEGLAAFKIDAGYLVEMMEAASRRNFDDKPVKAAPIKEQIVERSRYS